MVSQSSVVSSAARESSATTLARLLQQSKESYKLTPFQTKVYAALLQVPEGYVTTYRKLGLAIHCSSSQAIGQAMKRNPLAPMVPCHRVIASDLTVGGYSGHRDGPKPLEKVRRLQEERVKFVGDSTKRPKVDASCVYHFSK